MLVFIRNSRSQHFPTLTDKCRWNHYRDLLPLYILQICQRLCTRPEMSDWNGSSIVDLLLILSICSSVACNSTISCRIHWDISVHGHVCIAFSGCEKSDRRKEFRHVAISNDCRRIHEQHFVARVRSHDTRYHCVSPEFDQFFPGGYAIVAICHLSTNKRIRFDAFQRRYYGRQDICSCFIRFGESIRIFSQLFIENL